MTQATHSSASATLSGRELALKRRKAMALHGKSGTAKAASVSKPSARRVKPAPAAMNAPVAASPAAASPAAASPAAASNLSLIHISEPTRPMKESRMPSSA